MYTAVSWTALAAIAVGGTYYYTQRGSKKNVAGRRTFTPAQTRRRDASKQRRESRDRRKTQTDSDAVDPADLDTHDLASAPATNGTGQAKKRKGKKQQQQQPQPGKVAQSSAIEPSDDKDEANDEDLEFARQLQDKITGVSLKKSDKPGTSSQSQNKKARKAAKRAEQEATAQNNKDTTASTTNGAPKQETSTASSTTGAEADDGEEDERSSSTTSLDLPYQPSGSNVSDMLPPPAKGASILNITAPSKPQTSSSQAKKPKPAQQEAESKKARQNRLKREAEKAGREEDEKERQRLLEKQRRSAREARGEPAKNGLGAPAPKSNAWTGGNGASAGKTAVNGAGLLDTFDTTSPSATKAGKGSVNGGSAGNTTDNDYASLPSEEEQLKLLKENDDDGWNTVPSKKAKQPNTTPTIENGGDTNGGLGGSSFPKGAKGTSANAEANGVAKLPRGRGGSKPKGNGNGIGAVKAEFWTAEAPAVGEHGDDSSWDV